MATETKRGHRDKTGPQRERILLVISPRDKTGLSRRQWGHADFQGGRQRITFLVLSPGYQTGPRQFSWGAAKDHQYLDTGENRKANAVWGTIDRELIKSQPKNRFKGYQKLIPRPSQALEVSRRRVECVKSYATQTLGSHFEPFKM